MEGYHPCGFGAESATGDTGDDPQGREMSLRLEKGGWDEPALPTLSERNLSPRTSEVRFQFGLVFSWLRYRLP